MTEAILSVFLKILEVITLTFYDIYSLFCDRA